MKAALSVIRKHSLFEPFIIVIIVLSAIILGLEASDYKVVEYAYLYKSINRIFIIIFVLEIGIRLYVDQKEFYKDKFNIFDAIIVFLTLVAELTVFQSLKIARVLRTFRIARLFTLHAETRMILNSMVTSISGLKWIMLFLLLDLYFFGLIGHVLFAEIEPGNFGTLGLSMQTLIQVMTFDSWYSGVAIEILTINSWYLLYFIAYIIITAFVLMNLIVGVIVDGVNSARNERESAEKAEIIKKAFAIEDKIKNRKLIKELKLVTQRRWLPLPVAMTRLQFSQDEIYKAIESDPCLRLRAVKLNKDDIYEASLMIEYTPVKFDFGVFENRASSIHVVTTQAVGDANIGHYSRTLANTLHSNYYSNEFYGTGELLEEFQINFASNENYYKPQSTKKETPFDHWKSTLLNHIKPGDLVIYITSANPDNEPLLHVVCGGVKNDTFDAIANPTVSNPSKVAELVNFIQTCSVTDKDDKIKVAGHQYYGNPNKNHITHFIRSQTNADVISIHVSMNLLQFLPIEQYYKSIKIIMDAIEQKWV